MKALICLTLTASVLFFVSCGMNTPAAVHAAPPATKFQLHGEGICPSGCVSQESPGNYLALRIGPQVTDLSAQQFSYTLPYDLHVTLIDAWLDTGFGDVNEIDSRLQIQWPDGQWTEFFTQYDRHSTNLSGQVQRSFPVNLTLTQGTIVTLYHVNGTCFNNGVASPPNCPLGLDTIWRLYTQK